MRPIEPIIDSFRPNLSYCNIHTNTHKKKKKKKIERFLARKDVLSGEVLGLNTLCRGCSIHTKLVRLLYPRGDKSEKVCTGYKV